MNVDLILETFNRHRVKYVLLGGMNFLLRHAPILTYDVDLWIEDVLENRRRCETALAELNAEWGAGDDDWTPVAQLPTDWLVRQAVFCLISPAGAIDIFRSMMGLEDWQASFNASIEESTSGGVPYRGLSDFDMLRCQYALDPPFQKTQRIAVLEAALKRTGNRP